MATKTKTRKSDDWEKELEKEAEADSAREKAGGGGGHQVSIKGRRFTFGGENLGREMKVVVVDYVYAHQLYDSKYKEDRASIPICFALSADGEDMAPHEDSVKAQSDACEGCPNNEWGSGRGRAKACRQGRRLALISHDDCDDVANAEIVMLNVPPTSAKNWGKYVKDLKAKLSRPCYAVVTTLGFDMDADYPTLTFEVAEKLERETVADIKERRDEARELLMTPYDPSAYKESDEDDEDDEDEDDDGDEDEKPAKKKAPAKKAAKKAPPKRRVEEDEEDEEDEEEDEEDEDDEDDEEDEDEDEDEDEEPKKGGKSRFRR